MRSLCAGILFFLLFLNIFTSYSQDLYTARGYWEETVKPVYLSITQKQTKGDSLTLNERAYLQDYQQYLSNYFQHLSGEEKQKYERLKPVWDRELEQPALSQEAKQFEWRNRDRFATAFYGVWYGTSLVILTDIDNAAAAGIPLITGGLWLLGPAINPKKYENITQSTMRASNSGKLLGLGYGAALALALTGDSENTGDLAFALSTVGSIGLGEAGFQWQKRKSITAGNIELMRHYGFLGPWVGLTAFAASGTEDSNVIGLGLVGGGILGLTLGNKAYKKYNYTKGDVDMISSLTLISTGLSFAVIAQTLEESNNADGLFFVSGAAAIAGTLIGQRIAKGAILTDKQGSTIGLSVAGAALIGIGTMAIAETESSTLAIGVPSVLALITHQALFNKFKRKNLELGLQGNQNQKNNFRVSMNVNPGNYFLDKQTPVYEYGKSLQRLQNPLVNLRITF